MRVFHGSNVVVAEIDLTRCKPGRDFGRGFYVTRLRHQAEEMALRIAKRSGGTPTVSEFEFDDFAREDTEVDMLVLEGYTAQWLDFIVANRQNRGRANIHAHDMVEGPVADDAVAVRIDDHLRGLVTREQFIEELRFKKPSHQLCFCTMQSLQFLTTPEVAGKETEGTAVRLLVDDGRLPLESTDVIGGVGK